MILKNGDSRQVYCSSWGSMGTRLVLDQGVPTIGHLVLWTRLCGGYEVLPMGGQVVQWTQYQDRHEQTYLGKLKG